MADNDNSNLIVIYAEDGDFEFDISTDAGIADLMQYFRSIMPPVEFDKVCRMFKLHPQAWGGLQLDS